MNDDRAVSLFFELFSGLPRQGPGIPDATRRALALIPPLGPTARILDLGCGTGAQTLVLADATAAAIEAIDAHPPFVAELNARAERLGLSPRVRARVGDMARLEYPPGTFDVVWSEGAAYSMGFDAALESWRSLLVPGGHLAVSELCWLTREPAPECRDFFASEYPAMRDLDAVVAAGVPYGYRTVGHFVLPPSAWWDDYYQPLERRLEAFTDRHRDDPVALEIAGQTAREIAIFTRHHEAYGYVFVVMQTPAA